MNIGHPLLLAASFACTAAIQAQTCSGGPAGGIDANGNQCGVEVAPAGEIDAGVWQRLSSRLAGRMPTGAATADVAAMPGPAGGAQTAASVSPAATGSQPISANATILLLPAGTAIMLPAGASLTTVDIAR